MGKIFVDFRKTGKLIARATVQDGAGWRQIFWEVSTADGTLNAVVEAAAAVVPGLMEEKAKVQNGTSVPKGGM